MSLGDFFSDDLKEEFAQRNIDLGNAILIKIPDFDINYDKFIVVVSKDQENVSLAFVVINSDTNVNVNYSPYLKSLQVGIDQQNHDFLERDSFVDCSKLREFPIQHVVDFLIEKPKRAVGNVSEDVLRSIHLTITTARTIERITKVKYGFI